VSQPTLVDVPTTGPSVVYYATDFGNIKIGRTSSPRRRGGELKVEMLLTFVGGEVEERRHQRMWSAHRIGNSEWFRPADDLLLWLAAHVVGGPPRRAAVLSQLIIGLKQRRAVAA